MAPIQTPWIGAPDARGPERQQLFDPTSQDPPGGICFQNLGQTPSSRHTVNHDERSGAYFALGWAKAIGGPVAGPPRPKPNASTNAGGALNATECGEFV